jgi:hypothetical protein
MTKREGFGLAGCLMLVGVVLILIPILAWGFGVAVAPWKGRGDAHKQLNSAQYRIAAYDHFFEQCSSIQGTEGSIDALIAQLNEAESQRTKDLVNSSLAGAKSIRLQAINDYNADARKNYTEGQFRDSDLPFYIEPTNYPDEGGKTSCGYD